MDFNFKSLYKANIVFVLDPAHFVVPDNAAFASIYTGEQAGGAKFADDPVIGTKYFHLPRLQLSVTLERTRLRIDDDSRLPPSETNLLKESVHILKHLFPSTALVALGFNYDFLYRFPQIISSGEALERFVSKDILKKAKLRDLGFQFSLEKDNGKTQEVYFTKLTGPAEIALHYNIHKVVHELPKQERLQDLFSQGYEAPDSVVKQLQII